MKACRNCNVSLPFSEFSRRADARDGHQALCKGCTHDYYVRYNSGIRTPRDRGTRTPEGRRLRRNANARKYNKKPCAKLAQVRSRLKRKFGLTLDQYNRMVEAQGGACAICAGLARSDRLLAVDHCHVTGKIRALLCNRCNRAIGMFCDDPKLLANALSYVLKHCRT